MDRKDLLKFCRYYKGEASMAKDTKAFLWEYEKKWVELMINDNPLLDGMISVYISNGLRDFEQMDNTPLTLKALLFNRYSHWLKEDADGFRRWYKTEYIGN
jgi:hypothetical protein